MSFIKKDLVLKRVDQSPYPDRKVLSGIARVEIENGVGELHLSLINLPYNLSGEYHALVIDDKNYHYFKLGARPTRTARIFERCPNIEKGFAVGVFIVKDDIPSTLAFARSDDCLYTLTDFKKAVAEKCLSDYKQIKRELEENATAQLNTVKPFQAQKETKNLQVEYDDEAVATENYFEFNDQIMNKLKSIKEHDNGPLRFENELLDYSSQEETNQNPPRFNSTKDATDNRLCQERQQTQPYFLSVQQELNGIFNKFPREQALEKIFSGSKWSKIYFSAEKYYVVGLVYEDEKEKYICYGVPATYSKNPPKELKGFCSFIPLSVFNMTGDGYWMMFQDAVTGKCIIID